MKKLIFGLIAVFFIISCENETYVEPTTHKIQFKFYSNPSLSHKSDENSFLLEGSIIRSGSEMSIISKDLEMSRTINQETGLESYIIHKKYSTEEKAQDRVGGPRIEFGYFYDGYDCWIAGTWCHGDNGESLFVPSSLETQILNNVCGWSNVA